MRPLSQSALPGLGTIGRRSDDQLDHRLAVLGDDDLFAASGVFHQLRKVGLGFVEVDLARHGLPTVSKNHGLVKGLVKLDQLPFLPA